MNRFFPPLDEDDEDDDVGDGDDDDDDVVFVLASSCRFRSLIVSQNDLVEDGDGDDGATGTGEEVDDENDEDIVDDEIDDDDDEIDDAGDDAVVGLDAAAGAGPSMTDAGI